MKRKVLWFWGAVLIIVSPVLALQQETHRAIEYVGFWREYNPGSMYNFSPSNTTIKTDFNSESDSVPLLTIPVPPSPKSEAVFLQFTATADVRWTNDTYRSALIYVYVRVKSTDIPQGIIVRTGGSILRTSDKNDTNSTYDVLDRHYRLYKCNLMRGIAATSYNGGFDFKDGNGDNVPDEIKLAIIEKLIDNGFTLEYSVAGTIQGIANMRLMGVEGEVTRLSK